jgi:hypothetical protein
MPRLNGLPELGHGVRLLAEEIDPSGLWWVGVLLSILSAVFGSLGDNLIKLSYTKEELNVAAGLPPTPLVCRPIWWTGMLCLTILNTGCTMAAYSFADASLTIPFAGLHICFNVGFARLLNHEHFTLKQLGFTLIIVGGVVIVLVAGNHDTVTFTVEQIAVLFKDVAFIVLTLLILLAISLLVPVMLLHYDARVRCFASSTLVGVIASITQVMAKVVSEVLNSALSGGGKQVFKSWVFIVALSVLLCAAVSQLFMLNRTLSHFNAFVVVPIYNSFLIVLGSVYAGVLFREYERFTIMQMVLMPIGVCGTAIGVGLLAFDHNPEAKDELALGPPLDPDEVARINGGLGVPLSGGDGGGGGSAELALVPLVPLTRVSSYSMHSPIMDEHFGPRQTAFSVHSYRSSANPTNILGGPVSRHSHLALRTLGQSGHVTPDSPRGDVHTPDPELQALNRTSFSQTQDEDDNTDGHRSPTEQMTLH